MIVLIFRSFAFKLLWRHLSVRKYRFTLDFMGRAYCEHKKSAKLSATVPGTYLRGTFENEWRWLIKLLLIKVTNKRALNKREEPWKTINGKNLLCRKNPIDKIKSERSFQRAEVSFSSHENLFQIKDISQGRQKTCVTFGKIVFHVYFDK